MRFLIVACGLAVGCSDPKMEQRESWPPIEGATISVYPSYQPSASELLVPQTFSAPAIESPPARIMRVTPDRVTEHSTFPVDVDPVVLFGFRDEALWCFASIPAYTGAWRLLRWNGVEWQDVVALPPELANIYAAVGVGPDEFWLVGLWNENDDGRTWVGRWNGAALTEMSSSRFDEVTETQLYLVAASSRDELWFSGLHVGGVLRWTPAGVEKIAVPREYLRSLEVVGAEVLVGLDGGVFRWNGQDFGEHVGQSSRSVSWIGGSGLQDLWTYEVGAPGESDTVSHWNGSGSQTYRSPYYYDEPDLAVIGDRLSLVDDVGVFVVP